MDPTIGCEHNPADEAGAALIRSGAPGAAGHLAGAGSPSNPFPVFWMVWSVQRGHGQKRPATRAKPLHDRGIAGMLPRIMSPGNDALPPKDAATDVSDATGARESSARPESNSDATEARESDEETNERSSEPSERGDRDETGSSADRGPARTGRRSASRRAARDEDDDDRPLPPQTEEELDVPKMYTVYMLGAMSALTVVLWFAAKLTCNSHPDQVREPKHFSTKDLAADPKNAAFEFHQKFELADYITALDLATGEMKRVVEAKLKECEQKVDECVEKQKKLAGTVESTAKVLDRNENRATVELTTSYKGNSVPKSYDFEVVKEGQFWRVATRRDAVANAAVPNTAPPVAPVEMPEQTPPTAQ